MDGSDGSTEQVRVGRGEVAVDEAYLAQAATYEVKEGYTARRADGAIICLFCGEISLPPTIPCKCPPIDQ